MRKSTHTFEYRALTERLTAMRAAAELSQRDLASRLKVPHSWVAKVESGERRLDLVEFGWVCAACGVAPADEAAAFFADPGLRRDASRRRATRRGGGRR